MNMKNIIKKIYCRPLLQKGVHSLKLHLRRENGQRGFILILALVIMMAMSLIGISLLMNISTDSMLARNEKSAKTAFQLAEAGVNEAIARLHLSDANNRYVGEILADANYRTTNWNVNNANNKNFGFSSVDPTRRSALGPDGANMKYDVTITYLDETNPEAFCDNNSTSVAAGTNKGANLDPVTLPPFIPVCNPAEVVMYGQDFNIDSTITKIKKGIMPVYHVISTGSSGTGSTVTTRQIEAYIGASTLNVDTQGALNTNGCTAGVVAATDVNGGSTCGITTPPCTVDGKNCTSIKTANDDMTTYLGDNLTSIVNMADMKLNCNSPASCNAVITGTTDADWGDFSGGTYSRMIYINNTSPVTIQGNDLGVDNGGRGILIVQGDLNLGGGFKWFGLIYVMGTLTLNGGGGGVNITGGAMANTTVNVNGGLNLVYSMDALKAVGRESSASAMLIWKRM